MKANSNKKKKDNGILNGYIGPIILFILVMVYLLASYGIKMNKKIKQQVFDSYTQELTSVANIYNRELHAVGAVADFASRQLVGVPEDELFSEDNISLIEKITEVFGACNGYIVKNDMSAVDINGNEYVSIAELDGFADSINELDMYSKLVLDSDGHTTFLVVAPISSNISLNGYVIIQYRPTVMATLTKDPRYSANKTFALVTSDGDVVEVCGAASEICSADSNILDNSGANYSDGTFTTFKQGISNLRTGHVRVSKGSEDKYLFYSPVDNYYAAVVMLSSQKDVKMSFNAAFKDLKTFLIMVSIVIAVIGFTILGIGIFNRTKHHMESEDLQYKADTDQLTDLYNKAATERLIKEYLEGDGKEKVSMMFVLDIDNFKKINDTQGHAFGDKVLSSLGHQIKSWFRVGDIIGRIGGDEFIIFVKDIKDPEAIKREGSRIMQFFEGFNVGDYTRYSPTASVGGAVFPNDADSFEALYKAADKAVYKSKHQGKNRVSFYADLNSDERAVVGNSEDPESRQGD